LQIGCPHCPSQINLPAAMADSDVTCDACGKSYRVPTPAAPVLAAAGPLPPLAILRTPGLAGNTAGGISPIPHLPAPIAGNPIANSPLEAGPFAGSPVAGDPAASHSPSPAGGARPLPPPPKLRRGATAGAAPFPWELSPEARASAAAIFGEEPTPGGDEDELEAVQRRLRKEKLRAYARWMVIGLGMLAMLLLAAFFLRR